MKNFGFFLFVLAVCIPMSCYGQKDKTYGYLKSTYNEASRSFELSKEAEKKLDNCFGSCDLLYMKKYVSEAKDKVRVAILNIEYTIENAKSSAESAGGYTDCDAAASEAYLSIEAFKEANSSLIEAQYYIEKVSSSQTSKEAKTHYDLIKSKLQAAEYFINLGITKINDAITQLSYCY